MGQEHVETRFAKSPPSHIPVITPRPSQSSLPSSLSTPQLGLVSPSRLPAVSASPIHTSGSNTSTPGVVGSLSQFRSFRNLLSFGSSKNHHAASPTTSVPRSFVGLRRSSNVERTTTNTSFVKSQEDLPIVSIEGSHTIELSHRVDEPLIDSEELQKKLGLRPTTPETVSPVSSSATSINTVDPPTTPSPLGISELSTIIEADTSGVSQNLRLDSSRDDFKLSLVDNGRTVKPVASGPLLRSRSAEQCNSFKRLSGETSALDLSSSQVSHEVMAALSGLGSSKGWLDTVIIEEKGQPQPETSEVVDDRDASFSLGAVDPDLVALLSPNRVSPSLRTSPSSSRKGSLPPSPRTPAPELDPPPRASTSILPEVPPPTQSTPARRSSSIARPTFSRLGTSSVPRLARSASERPQSRADISPLPSPTRSPTSEQSSSSAGRSRPSLQIRRTSPTSEPRSQLPRRPSSAGRDTNARRTAISRLVTPSRHLTASRVGLRHLDSSPASPNYDADDSTSPRAGSSVGSPRSRRDGGQRPSLDDSASARAQSRLGIRERSTSLTESTQYHPAAVRPTDWLGPRTARAFAAAGLLDLEKEGSVTGTSRPGSRFGTTRSERDVRSQYAPSRMGFSEVGSRSSWSRRSGSISRTVASSEVLSSHGAESASTPRTAFSAASTAPTSVSAASSSQKHLQTELQLLQDRHALETGALLNALADSQRTTRLLRDENTQLRDQIQCLEDRLTGVMEELRRLQLAPPPKLPRTNFYRLSGATADTARKPLPHSRLQTVVHPPAEPEDIQETIIPYKYTPSYDPMPSPKLTHARTDSYSDTHKRRHSTSSSIFPVLPSNMSMLLHDEGASDHAAARSTRSTSPSSTLPGIPVPSMPSDEPYETHHRRVSSTGNISPTTANFSMMTGSPSSFNLRPEHEQLLGDMPTLDLCAEDYE